MQSRVLLLVRHAEAAAGAVDADRPLTASGERRAAAIGAWLTQTGLVPDLVLVSPARRAAQTWEEAGASLPPDLRSAVDARIYENTVEGLLALVREIPGDARTVAVIGHNPAIGELARALDDGQGNPEAVRAIRAGFPAGGAAAFGLAGDFPDLAPGTARLRGFTAPDR
jgi:phosphohistidine phosphatase